MSDDDAPLKSAYELAMERLRAEDREAGADQRKSLTHEQRETIAELRQTAKARLAEIEILHHKEIASAADPEKLTQLEERYEIDRRRIDSRLETEIARVRRGEQPTEED